MHPIRLRGLFVRPLAQRVPGRLLNLHIQRQDQVFAVYRVFPLQHLQHAALGVGLWSATLAVRYRDVRNVVNF